MSDEQLQEATPTAEANYGELDALKNSIEALERKNHELIGKLKKAKSVPDNVDVQALLDFKAKAEQAELDFSRWLQATMPTLASNELDAGDAALRQRLRDAFMQGALS